MGGGAENLQSRLMLRRRSPQHSAPGLCSRDRQRQLPGDVQHVRPQEEDQGVLPLRRVQGREEGLVRGGQWGTSDVATGGRAVAVDGDGESRDQVRLPQPPRGLHEDDPLQALDRESDRRKLIDISQSVISYRVRPVEIKKELSLNIDLEGRKCSCYIFSSDGW